MKKASVFDRIDENRENGHEPQFIFCNPYTAQNTILRFYHEFESGPKRRSGGFLNRLVNIGVWMY